MKKQLVIFSSVFLSILLVMCSLSPIIKMSEDISKKVFRLHILANSDEAYDQELKLKVRDDMLILSEELFSECKSVKDAVNSSSQNISNIISIAENTVKQNGYNYSVKAYTAKEYFNTREYDDFTLPAGIYDCLKIEIGEGKGKNWWCVMFPSVCLSGCTDDFDISLSEEEKRLIENDKYIVRFKVVEIYERIKNKH